MNDIFAQAILEGAQNPQTLPETLNRWAEKESAEVQLAIIGNPNTSFSTLVELSKAEDIFISRAAISTIYRSMTEGLAA